MKIDLSDSDIDAFLESQCYGHIGCSASSGKQYIVPITFVYHEGAIYSFSFEGRKIAMLRENPKACFQVEDLTVEKCWKSVIVWGDFEELKGDERSHAFQLLINRLWAEEDHLGRSILMPFRESLEALKAAREEEGTVLYRINLTEKTGRFEQAET